MSNRFQRLPDAVSMEIRKNSHTTGGLFLGVPIRTVEPDLLPPGASGVIFDDKWRGFAIMPEPLTGWTSEQMRLTADDLAAMAEPPISAFRLMIEAESRIIDRIDRAQRWRALWQRLHRSKYKRPRLQSTDDRIIEKMIAADRRVGKAMADLDKVNPRIETRPRR